MKHTELLYNKIKSLTMTREQQKQVKAEKQTAKINARIEKRQEKQALKGWNKMVQMAKDKGAWIEDETN